MKKILMTSLLLGAFGTPAMAQTVAPAAPAAAEAAPAHTLTANVGVFSSYRFRGIDQTFGKPALQGGFDYNHESGFYVGNWNSNVNSGAGFPDGNLEMDFYGGYKKTFGDFGIDVGAYYYVYPGSEGRVLGTNARSGAVENKELYIGASWKILSLKYSRVIGDYFSLRGWDNTGASTGASTKGSGYVDLSANYDMGNGWGINGHVGHLNLKNSYKGSYTDWKVGVTKDISGWVLGVSYVGTNASGKCSGAAANEYQFYCFSNSNSAAANGTNTLGTKTTDAGRGIGIVSISRSF
jgi:uncharacterized protein (TIGR02001 family)